MTKETLQDRWNKGSIGVAMLKIYVKKGIITKEEFKAITGEEYR